MMATDEGSTQMKLLILICYLFSFQLLICVMAMCIWVFCLKIAKYDHAFSRNDKSETVTYRKGIPAGKISSETELLRHGAHDMNKNLKNKSSNYITVKLESGGQLQRWYSDKLQSVVVQDLSTVDFSFQRSSTQRQSNNNNANKFNTTKFKHNCENKRFIAYMCVKGHACGGFGDRLKGIISTFLLAELLNRTFVIIHNDPCELSDLLLPNLYDWTQCTQYVLSMPKGKTKTLDIMYGYDYRFRNALKHINFEEVIDRQAVFIHTNQIWINQICARPSADQTINWAVGKSIPEVSNFVLTRLFRPSKWLENKVRSFMKLIPSSRKLICSHIRIGRNPSLKVDLRRPWGVPDINAIFNFLRNFDNPIKYAIYVASDSEEVKRHAKRIFSSVITIDMPIIHIDRYTNKQSKASCQGMQTVVFEQQILSKCNILLLTHSGLGTMAAYFSALPQKIFIFYKNQTIFQIARTELQNYFNFH